MIKKGPSTFCENPLTYKDFRYLPQGEDTILLDKDSLDLMYNIQETLRMLEPERRDDARTLRIETIGQNNMICWYDVTLLIYRDIHGLYLHSYQGEHYYFANKANWTSDERPTRHSCQHFLWRLWNYLGDVVLQINRKPMAYTRYLEEHVPFQERKGNVMRREVQNLLPGIKINISNRKQVLDLLKRKQDVPAEGYETMTLRTYIEAWKLAYCAYCQAETLKQKPAEEVFQHSNQGTALEKYDLDSREDFARWQKERYPYHCYDVVYVRVHLYPEHDYETKKWYLDLSFELEAFGDIGFRIAFALEEAGIPFIINGAEDKLDALMGEDTIYFSPDERDYQLPYPGEKGVIAEKLQKAIDIIRWQHFEDIHPFPPKDNLVKAIFYPCDEFHGPTPDEDTRCLIRYLDNGKYKYWLKISCPLDWNALSNQHAEYCVLPNWPAY